MKTKLVSAFFLLGMSIGAQAAADPMALLWAHFGKQIEVPRKSELWYCPDNTCETYVANDKEATNALPAFVFLYLYRKSDYIYLNESFEGSPVFRQTAQHDAELVATDMARFCSTPVPTIDCVLEGMQKQLKINVGFIRFGE
jgi:hypothetical protein